MMSLYARIRRRLCFSFLALHDMQTVGDYEGHEISKCKYYGLYAAVDHRNFDCTILGYE